MLTDTKKSVAFFLGGAALATASFLYYYLIEPRNWVVLSIFCAADFLYLLLNAYLVLEYSDKRLLKALGLSVGYIALFNILPLGYLLIEGFFSRITELWKDILLYSFFTGPCFIVIIFIVFLIVLVCDYASGGK